MTSPQSEEALIAGKLTEVRGPFYHGGPRGLMAILPAAETGADSTSILVGPNAVHNPACVYVTPDWTAATMFAAGHDHGCVYEVAPVNPRPDPDCSQPGLSWECDRAQIIRRHRIAGKALKLARKALLDDPQDHPVRTLKGSSHV